MNRKLRLLIKTLIDATNFVSVNRRKHYHGFDINTSNFLGERATAVNEKAPPPATSVEIKVSS